MLKKIRVNDLKIGMHIHEMCGSWMDHPFMRNSFRLDNVKDLKTLQNCDLKEVWIDTQKGLDVGLAVQSVTEENEKSRTQAALIEADKAPIKAEIRASYAEEIVRARNIQAKAKKAVTSMFHEARMGKALDIVGTTVLVDEINDSISRNPGALLNLARLKTVDDYTYLHSVAVCGLMIALGKQLGIDETMLKEIGMAGLLHDVGKAVIPEKVLNKPGKLTDEEFNIIKTHPLKGHEILLNSYGVGEMSLDVCLHHHERVDGKGYPESISGEALSLFARMGAVCDVYDAITSNRCYKPGWEPADSIRKMAEWKDGHFDETIFQAFVKTIGIYPTGTLLRLRSGRLGFVTDQSEKSLLTPKVKVFFSTKSQAPIAAEIIDIEKSQDAIMNVEDPAKWGFDLKKIMG